MSGPAVRELRSDRTVLRQVLGCVLGIGGAAAVVLAVGIVVGSARTALLAGLFVAVCVVLTATVVRTIATVTVGDGSVALRRWSGRRVVLPLDELQALQAPFVSGFRGLSRSRLVVLRSPGMRRRITLHSGSWSPAVLDELVSIVGVDTATGFMDAREWQRRAPGLLPWTYRHPWLAVFGGVLVTLVLLIVLISWVPVPASS